MADWKVIEPDAPPAALTVGASSGWTVIDPPTEEELAEQETAKRLRNNEMAGRAFLTGATFGLMPRAEAAVKSLFSDKTYDEELEDIRKKQAEWAEENAGAAFAAEVGGGFLVPGSLGVKTGIKAAQAARAAGAGAGASAVIGTGVPGGIVGAGYGAGTTEDFTDVPEVLKDTAVGGGVGFVAGPIVGGVANKVWGATKTTGAAARDVFGRLAEPLGWDATNAATRNIARVAEGDSVARLPGVSREQGRRTASDLQTAVNNSHINGVDDSLVAADPRLAALADNLAGQTWMPDEPFTDFATRTIGGQQERVARGVSETLHGGPVDHNRLMAGLEHGATAAQDAAYTGMRNNSIGGRTRDLQIRSATPPTSGPADLRELVNGSPDARRYMQQAIEEVVESPRVTGFDRTDAERIFATPRGNRQLLEDVENARVAKLDADAALNGARADYDEAVLNGAPQRRQQALRDVRDQAGIDANRAAETYKNAQSTAAGVTDAPEMLSNNVHTYVAERFYHNLSQAANGGDQIARQLLERYQLLLNGSGRRAQALMEQKGRHSEAFRNLEAGQLGESIWGTSGPTRRAAEGRITQLNSPAQEANAREAAAGAAGLRVAGDTGSFARPNNIVGSAENRATMDSLFGQPAREATQDLVGREANLHERATSLLASRTRGNSQMAKDDVAQNLIRFAVQQQFTPSVAYMNLYARSMTGITKQRGAAMAQLLTTPGGVARVQAQMRAWQAARDRVGPRRQAISAGSQVLMADPSPDPTDPR